MPGYFSSFFDGDEPTSFFGRYRPRAMPPSNSDSHVLVPINDALPAPLPTSGAAPDVLTFPDGTPVMDFNTGQPYPRPDRLHMQNNIATGQVLRQLADAPPAGLADPNIMFGLLFPHGSLMDYQRPLSQPNGPFDKAKTNVSAYNFSVVGAAAGYDLEDLLNGAGSYNLWSGNPQNAATSYGLSKARALSIKQGYDDYKTGRWSRNDADGPLSEGEP